VKVTKAVIPVGGLGTRFLPATKAQPKEMMPVVDTPTIQWVVEEAVAAGLTDVLIITGRGKRSIEDHFDRAPQLEAELERSGKHELLSRIRAISEIADIHYIRQTDPRGLGDAVGLARHHVGSEPFAVLLGDVIMQGPLLEPMLKIFEQFERSVIGLQEVPAEQVEHYGVAAVEATEDPSLVLVSDLVEKPPRGTEPSRLGIVGRYLLTPDIFEFLDRSEAGWGGEVQLTDALAGLARSQAIYGYLFDGEVFDIGNKLEHLRASLELAARRDDLRDGVFEIVRSFVARHGLN
jgi:UTP--glucose-1-phosphate uridylyltransferase